MRSNLIAIINRGVELGEFVKIKTKIMDVDFKFKKIDRRNDFKVIMKINEQKYIESGSGRIANITTPSGERFSISSFERPELGSNELFIRGRNSEADEDTCGRYFDSVEEVANYMQSCILSLMALTPEYLDKGENYLEIATGYVKGLISDEDKEYYLTAISCEHCGDTFLPKGDERHCDKCIALTWKCEICGARHTGARKEFTVKGNKHCKKCLLKEDEKYADWHDYSYKVPPVFYGNEHDFKFGCEVEVERVKNEGYNNRDIAHILSKFSNHLYYKTDGSLSSNGFEIITHPCSIEYHKENTVPMLEALGQLGVNSDNHSQCGLHAHIGVDRFGDTEEKRKHNIGRLIWLYSHFYGELYAISMRGREIGYCEPHRIPTTDGTSFSRLAIGSSANREDGAKPTPSQWYDLAYRAGRYKIINLENSATVELRFPQSTLKGERFIAHLQTYSRAIDIANSDIDFTEKGFKDLFLGHYDELDNHINSCL